MNTINTTHGHNALNGSRYALKVTLHTEGMHTKNVSRLRGVLYGYERYALHYCSYGN